MGYMLKKSYKIKKNNIGLKIKYISLLKKELLNSYFVLEVK